VRRETEVRANPVSRLTSHVSRACWTLFVDVPRAGWENMAVDAALLDRTLATGEAFLRCYQWEPHCLSFGRHEPALRRYDTGRIRALGLSCVRRPTGGRAVWHARELTYAVTAPLSAFGGMREAYNALHALLAAALGTMGVRALLAPRSSPTPAVGSGPCFATPVGGEVLVNGRKVVGSAQLRSGDAFLQHGSLLLADDQGLVGELAGLTPATLPGGCPARPLGRELGFEEALEAVLATAETLLEGAVREEGLPAGIAALASPHAARFRSDTWTWQR
jgi:lipoate-protein ligase A